MSYKTFPILTETEIMVPVLVLSLAIDPETALMIMIALK